MMMKQQKVILEENISNLSSVASGDLHANSCSENKDQENGSKYLPNYFAHPPPSQSQPLLKKKRNLPGNPDPEAEVISLSPTTLMATNRFLCEICNKGFQRDQNLQLHRRGHNLPWKLKQRNKNEIVRKKVYVCPEVNCVHHEPSRALGDLTGIKKHFSRKHGEKKWKCDKCSKRYAVQSDWKAHSKTCGTREYKCDCGTLFSRRDSFITHRAFCDALAEESARAITGLDPSINTGQIPTHLLDPVHSSFMKKEEALFPSWLLQTQSQDFQDCNLRPNSGPSLIAYHPPPPPPSAYMSATALLQKAAQMGTSHLSIGTSIQAPCTTSFQPHHQQYQPHVSDGTSGSSSLPDDNACVGGAHLSLPQPHHPYPMSLSMIMMMNQDSSAYMSTFEDDFSQILDAKKEEKNDHIVMNDSKNTNGNNNGNDGNIRVEVRGDEGMTRDFLGVESVNRYVN